MRVALPLFGSEISPQFCFAREMLVVAVQENAGRPDGPPESRERLSLEGLAWPDRLRMLSLLRVDVLLCGGLPREFQPYAEAVGVRVIVGLGGEAERVLDAFRRGKIDEVRVGCGGRRRRRRRCARGPNGPGG